MQRIEPTIVGGTRLLEYLRGRVQKAVLNLDIELQETTEFYLVNLLSNFGRSDFLFRSKDDRFEMEPLAMMLAHAINADTATQIRGLKRLGDTALYVSGFFASHIKKGPVGVNYYVDMGSSAYEMLAGRFSSEDVFAGLYSELSAKFCDLTLVLEELSVADAATSNIELLRLYERWLKTGSENARKKLAREGIAPGSKKAS